jgi:anti-anti-sigma factor
MMFATHMEGEQLVIELPGSLAHKQAQEFLEVMEKEIEKGFSTIIADATRLEFIDSYAIGLLVKLLKQLQARGGYLALRGLAGETREFFQDTGLLDILPEALDHDVLGAQGVLGEAVDDLEMKIKSEIVRDISVFHFSGVINSSNAVRIFKEQVLISLWERKKVLLDFCELTFFDSSTIAELINIYKLLNASGGEMRISNTANLVDNLLESTSVESIIPCFPSVEEALDAW